MSSKAVGILNLHYCPECEGINSTRSLASTSFLGRYAFMDFPLSNFANSGIDRMAVLVKKNLRSIIQHIGDGHIYNENSKLGGLSILYDEPYATSPTYNHDINNLIENSWFLKSIPDDVEVCIIAPTHMIYKMDFRPYIDEHIKNNNKISIFYKQVDNAKSAFIGEYKIKVNDQNIVTDISKNLSTSDDANIYMQTAIIDKEVLKGLIHLGKRTSSLYTLNDVLAMIYKDIPIHAYKFDGYLRCFDSLKHYLDYSKEVLNPEIMKVYFDSSWPVYTKSYDTPPVKYGDHASVKQSFIANGCRIDGTVINSIIGRDVVVKEGAYIKDSIILSGSYISESTHLEYVVCDKEARIIHTKKIVGGDEKVIYIKRGDIV